MIRTLTVLFLVTAAASQDACSGFSVTTSFTQATSGHNDGTLTASVTGGAMPYMYQLKHSTGQNFGIDDPVSSNYFEGLAAGLIYAVRVTDANGCQADSVGYRMTEDPCSSLEVTTTSTQPSPRHNDGTIDATASGGSPPYTYQLKHSTGMGGAYDDPVSDPQFTGLAPDLVYAVRVIDNRGCQAESVGFWLREASSECTDLHTSYTAQDTSCTGNGDGSITIVTSGGASPYYYNLNRPDSAWVDYYTATTYTNLLAGEYVVRTTDSNGCVTETGPIFVGDGECGSPTPDTDCSDLQLTIVKTDVSCPGQFDGKITVVSTTGGTAPYYYQLSVDSNLVDYWTATEYGYQGEGDYAVVVTDSAGCIATSATMHIGANSPNCSPL
jgi:hypothetical protein